MTLFYGTNLFPHSCLSNGVSSKHTLAFYVVKQPAFDLLHLSLFLLTGESGGCSLCCICIVLVKTVLGFQEWNV